MEFKDFSMTSPKIQRLFKTKKVLKVHRYESRYNTSVLAKDFSFNLFGLG